MIGNDDRQYLRDKFEELQQIIKNTSESPSQDEMDKIVQLFQTITAGCEEVGIDPNDLTGDGKKK